MKKGLTTLLGYLLLVFGVLGILLQMLGIKFSFLLWVDSWGEGVGFVIRLGMILVGVLVIAVSTINLKAEREELLREAAQRN